MSDSLWLHELQHARPPLTSPTPGLYPNSCPSSQWCHPAISSSVVPFSSCLQSFPALGSFPMSQFFASGAQSTGVSASASVLPMNIQGWFPLGWADWISLRCLIYVSVITGSRLPTVATWFSHWWSTDLCHSRLSQYQGLFQWVRSLHQVTKVLELQLHFFQWIIRVDFL